MYHRRSVRLRDYDYARAGAYFVTICTYHRQMLFGEVRQGEVGLNALGALVASEWTDAITRRPYARSDAFVVMPNHVHGIVRFIEDGRPTTPQHIGLAPCSLGAFIGHFKQGVTRASRLLPSHPPRIWQRSYHDHIIRTPRALDNIRRYIHENPARWASDRYHS